MAPSSGNEDDGLRLAVPIGSARRLGHRIRLAADTLVHPPLYRSGHYYSPIASPADVKARESVIFATPPPPGLVGIDLHAEEQLRLVDVLAGCTHDQPFGDDRVEGLRYRFGNSYFGHGDGIVLHAMLRHLRPGRLVEVGSGFSSALILDTNDRFLDGRLHCTFIDPYPDRLLGLLRPGDRASVDVVSTPVQDVSLGTFEELGRGDVLFIDSSHVSKVGSDVNFLLHEVLPRLAPGVMVHIHDVFYPFEYPREWVLGGKAFNEAYMVRAFLEFNGSFQIRVFNHYLKRLHRPRVAAALPPWDRNPGASLWLERV